MASLTPEILIDRLLATGTVAKTEIVPCTSNDLIRIKRLTGQTLPPSYLLFLKTLGRGAGEFMSDLSIFYPALLRNNESMKKILADVQFSLPDEMFVLCHRYGEQMLYINLNDCDDPAIYYWSDDEPTSFTRKYNSFWDWIEDELKGYEYSVG